MKFAGKEPADMTNEELEFFAVYCTRAKHQAAMQFELNDAGLQELVEEYAKRHGFEIEPEAVAAGKHEIN